MNLTDQQKTVIKEHCIEGYKIKEEVCGAILCDGAIKRLENISASKGLDPFENFCIDLKTYSKYELQIQAIYHSHINGNPNFTPSDAIFCRRTNKPLLLFDFERNLFKLIDPTGNTNLIGRDFVFGIYDCYSLVRDYYKQKLKIELKDYPRSEYLTDRGYTWDAIYWNIIDSNILDFGFTEVTQPQKHDLIGFSLGVNPHVNHLGVYVGDDLFFHQLCNHQSRIELWGDPWARYAIKFWRYKKS